MVAPQSPLPATYEATPANFAAKLRDANTGDTILLTTGTYSGTFNVNIVSGLTLQAKAGNKPVIDGGFIVGKSGVTFQGLEILNSSWANRASAEGIPFGIEVTAQAPNCKVRNCLIHDTNTGVIAAADGLEVTGCVFWNIGATTYEHDIYLNNVSTVSLIRDNVFAQGYSGWAEQAWSSVGGQCNNIQTTYNVAVNSKHINFAQGVVTSGVVFSNNEGWSSYIRAGQASQNNADVAITNNYLVYGRDNLLLEVQRWNSPTVTGNTLIGDADDSLVKFVPATDAPMMWDTNTYIRLNTTATKFVDDDGTERDFAGWKTAHAARNADVNSTEGTTLPATNRIVMHANPIDAERAWIAVYNWENSTSVSLDLSSLGLSNGTDYILRQAQDPKTDTQTFTYDGSAVTMSMAAIDHSVATPTGAAGPIVATTFPAFGCWLLEIA